MNETTIREDRPTTMPRPTTPAPTDPRTISLEALRVKNNAALRRR